MESGERLAKLKSALGITGEDKDALLILALETVESMVLSYIAHYTLPTPLEGPLILMTASYWKGAGLGNDQPSPGPVASVSRGDTSTSFAVETGAGATAGTFDLTDGGNFFGWRTALNAHRKLRWSK